MKKKVLILIAISLLVVLSVPVISASTEVAIRPSADSYVAGMNPDVNYGTNIFLYSYNWQNVTNNIYIKFDLSSISTEATIKSVTLRMHDPGLYASTPATIGVFLCTDNSWTETGITYNNAPSARDNPLATVDIDTSGYGFGMVGADYDFNLTGKLPSITEFTLVLKTLNNTWSPDTFSSREGDYSPKLIISYDMPMTFGLPLILGVGAGIAVVVVIGVFAFTKRQRKTAEKPRQENSANSTLK